MIKKVTKKAESKSSKPTKNNKELLEQEETVKKTSLEEDSFDPSARLEIKKGLIEPLLLKGKKLGYLTYEEIMEFSHKHHLSDQDTNTIMRIFDKENIDLLMQEELDTNSPDLHDYEKEDEPLKSKNLKEKFESSIDIDSDEDLIEEDEDTESEDEERLAAIKETVISTQIADGVKCYLRDIGKIPLLNKKTETVIAEQIASGKKGSIEAISKFPFIHKELVSIGERLQKDSIALKDVIQFSEFDQENLPKVQEEKDALLATIKTIADLIDNEEKNISIISW